MSQKPEKVNLAWTPETGSQLGNSFVFTFCTEHVSHVSLSVNSNQTYLKEIMKEIGTYNNKGPHKSTWELKPEYRHYQPGEEDEEMQTT